MADSSDKPWASISKSTYFVKNPSPSSLSEAGPIGPANNPPAQSNLSQRPIVVSAEQKPAQKSSGIRYEPNVHSPATSNLMATPAVSPTNPALSKLGSSQRGDGARETGQIPSRLAMEAPKFNQEQQVPIRGKEWAERKNQGTYDQGPRPAKLSGSVPLPSAEGGLARKPAGLTDRVPRAEGWMPSTGSLKMAIPSLSGGEMSGLVGVIQELLKQMKSSEGSSSTGPRGLRGGRTYNPFSR